MLPPRQPQILRDLLLHRTVICYRPNRAAEEEFQGELGKRLPQRIHHLEGKLSQRTKPPLPRAKRCEDGMLMG